MQCFGGLFGSTWYTILHSWSITLYLQGIKFAIKYGNDENST
jgi:hypothetical protein